MPKCSSAINNESENDIGDSEVCDCIKRSIVEVVARNASTRPKQQSWFEEHHFTLRVRRPYFGTPNRMKINIYAVGSYGTAELWSAAAFKFFNYLRVFEQSELPSFFMLRRNMSFRIVFEIKNGSGFMLWGPMTGLSVQHRCFPHFQFSKKKHSHSFKVLYHFFVMCRFRVSL